VERSSAPTSACLMPSVMGAWDSGCTRVGRRGRAAVVARSHGRRSVVVAGRGGVRQFACCASQWVARLSIRSCVRAFARPSVRPFPAPPIRLPPSITVRVPPPHLDRGHEASAHVHSTRAQRERGCQLAPVGAPA
jgi:hypothetical protein